MRNSVRTYPARLRAVAALAMILTGVLAPAATVAAQQAPERPAPLRAPALESAPLAQEQGTRRRPNVVAGVIGFVVGAAAGAALGCAANRDSYGVYCGGQNDTKVFVGAALGGVAGAAIGALVFARER